MEERRKKRVEFSETPLRFIKSKIKWVYVGSRIKKKGNKETEKIIEEMKAMIKGFGVKIVRGNKPKSSGGGLSITIHSDNKKGNKLERDIVGTNQAIYIKNLER